MSRKQWLIVKLILLIWILYVLCRISIKVMSHSRLDGNKFGFKMDISMPIVEGEKKSFSNVERVVIDAISLPVRIYESDVTEVTLQDNSTAYGLGVGKPNRVSHKDGILIFEQAKRISFLSFVSGDIVIEVPRGSLLEYDIESISGGINHDVASRGTLRAKTISGSIKIYQGGETVFAESTSGSVQIGAPFKEVIAESVSGSIKVLANQDSTEMSGSSVSGSVRIQLEKVSGYEMSYSTVSGSVKDTYSNIAYSKSGKATTGDESLKINASSVSGSIKLEDWE